MSRFSVSASSLGVFAMLVGHGQLAASGEDGPQLRRAPRTVLKLPTPEPGTNEHALMPLIRHAEQSYDAFGRQVNDYSCIMVRRERVAGRLRKHEFIYAKVRHQRIRDGKTVVPFSVYLKFLKPTAVKGREVLFVAGRNDGQMFVRRGGRRFAFVTSRMDPNSDLAMRENRYPITEFGIKNMIRRLVVTARTKLNAPCEVEYLQESKINDRAVTGIIVKPRVATADFYETRVFVDHELNLPIHYEAYGAPREPGGEPALLEQYTYTKLQLNLGYADADFDADNPEYQVK